MTQAGTGSSAQEIKPAPLHPEEHKHREMPCHFISLNEAGETVDSPNQVGDREKLEEAVANCLGAPFAD